MTRGGMSPIHGEGGVFRIGQSLKLPGCTWILKVERKFVMVNSVRKPVIHRYLTVLCLLLEVDPSEESESGQTSSLEAR